MILPAFKTVLLWTVCRTECASYNLKNRNMCLQLLVDQGFVGPKFPQQLPLQSPANRQQLNETDNVFFLQAVSYTKTFHTALHSGLITFLETDSGAGLAQG